MEVEVFLAGVHFKKRTELSFSSFFKKSVAVVEAGSE